MESIRFKTEETKVEVKNGIPSESQLKCLINKQRVSNILLRANADNLFQLVISLAGETPRDIYQYDKILEENLPHIESLAENNIYCQHLLEDIKNSIHHLEILIK